ncbi:MAG: Na+/H+ antiporter NhaA [Gemmatimonadaceae bacterium]
MTQPRPARLDRPVDDERDHVLGNPDAAITVVEYGSYACPYCHVAHQVIGGLRERFGDRMRYVFRHVPLAGRKDAVRAARIAEFAGLAADRFWPVHDALMRHPSSFERGELDRIADDLDIPPRDDEHAGRVREAAERVREDATSAARSGVLVTPTFFINGRRYEGPWDESALAEAMLGSLGHRLHAASVDFVRWAPSTGLLLLLMAALALVLSNSPAGAAFQALWSTPVGLNVGGGAFTMPLVNWVNDGLLTMFFLVVGLEIKRELTVGRLASRRAAALPLAAAIGGMIAPALIFLAVVPPGPWATGWGLTIATDTAFAVALIVLLGSRVPVELRVFLTAAVIVDDLVAIVVVAVFYSGAVQPGALLASLVVTVALVALERSSIYRPLPYVVLGMVLWVFIHQAGLHATLAGVILAAVVPARPPANLAALMAQAEAVLRAEQRTAGDEILRRGPSEPTLRALDAIHDRIESPASKLLRTVEPWSSYLVLPVFALANAGVAWSSGIIEGHGRLMLAVVLGLVLGKPAGIFLGSRLAVGLGVAVKPDAYSWRQLAGAGALAGIGFTMSLFIAGQAFPDPADFAAVKVAIFTASLLAGGAGLLVLWPSRRAVDDEQRAGILRGGRAGDGSLVGSGIREVEYAD